MRQRVRNPKRGEERRIRVNGHKEEEEKREKKKGKKEEGPTTWSQSLEACTMVVCLVGAFQSLEHAFQYTIRDNLFSLIHPYPSSICHDFL